MLASESKWFGYRRSTALVSMIKGIQRRKALQEQECFQESSMKSINFSFPHNVYIDRMHNRCFHAINSADAKVKLVEYTRIEPLFIEPVISFEIGCYLVHSSSWRYAYLDESNVHSFRRGMAIDMSGLPGLEIPELSIGKSVFLSTFHEQSHDLF
ncbi:MAG: hypothetical protein AAGK05_17320 [Pseudomonadota bacterium]